MRESYEEVIKGINANNAKLTARLEQSDKQRSEFEFQFQEENVKVTDLRAQFNELQYQMGQKSDELATLKLSQNQSETNIEFVLNEHKVVVQKLEAKLAQMGKEKKELSKKLEAGVLESNEAQCSQIKELKSQLKKLNERITESSDELNAKAARLDDLEKLEVELKALNEAKVNIFCFNFHRSLNLWSNLIDVKDMGNLIQLLI